MFVSKDSDLEQRSLLHGSAPKCIWLRVGNCSTKEIEERFRHHASVIGEFFEAEGESYLILS